MSFFIGIALGFIGGCLAVKYNTALGKWVLAKEAELRDKGE